MSFPLDVMLQRRVEEIVEAKLALAMTNVERRFAEMMEALDQKQKALIAAREAAERERLLLEGHISSSNGPVESYEKRWYRDCPFEVRDCPGKGRGLFAKQDLKKGDVLLAPIPYCSAVYESCKQYTCRYCFYDAEGDKPQPFKFMCTSCKDVWYCSQHCREADRPIHKAEECHVMREWELDPETYSGEVVTELKLLLRVLSMKAYERLPNYVPRTDGIKYDDYCKLVAGKEDYDADTIQELHFWLVDYIYKLRKWMGKKEEASEILDIILRNRRNGFFVAAIHGPNPVGTAVFVTPSFFNHSCTSNVWYQTDNARRKPRSFEYLALNDIRKDEELCITYLDDDDVKKPVAQRRAQLFETFRFTCGCARCTAEAAQAPAAAPATPADATPSTPAQPSTASTPAVPTTPTLATTAETTKESAAPPVASTDETKKQAPEAPAANGKKEEETKQEQAAATPAKTTVESVAAPATSETKKVDG